MKLIDADELKKEFPHDKYWFLPVNTNGYVVETINRMPTVDAIPIERLEQEIDRYIDLGLNSVAKELRTIVDDWRKENESNIDD